MLALPALVLFMAWFKVADGRVVCSGQISRDPFVAWIATAEGSAAITAIAAGLRFRLFGKSRAARRQVWRELSTAIRSEQGRAALQDAADIYSRCITSLAYAQGLPRTTIDLHRLVLVPRALIADRSRAAISTRLSQCGAFATRPEAERSFLLQAVMAQVDDAMCQAKPSIHKPLKGSEGWAFIGVDSRFQWVDRYWSGERWTGHWFVYELPPARLSRANRSAIEQAAARLGESVGNLSRDRRQALVQLAAS
jgi:hypothetical protein